jgi:hypothetical protein
MPNQIHIVPTAQGYHGTIAGRQYGLETPEAFREVAEGMFPQLLFEVVIK